MCDVIQHVCSLANGYLHQLERERFYGLGEFCYWNSEASPYQLR
jgi:hypothetical protein